MMKGYIMEQILKKFEEIDKRTNKGVADNFVTAGDGAKELVNMTIDGATEVVLFTQNRLIDVAIKFKSDPTKRGVKYKTARNILKRLKAFKDDVETINKSLDSAIEDNDDDEIEQLEAELYEAKIGVQTYELQLKKVRAK